VSTIGHGRVRVGHPFSIELPAVSLRRAAEESAPTDATVSPSLDLGAIADQLGAPCEWLPGKKEDRKRTSVRLGGHATTLLRSALPVRSVQGLDCGPRRLCDWLAGLDGLWISCGARTFYPRRLSAEQDNHRMAGPSDKARFYLEQSATELNELERKKIFTRVGAHFSALPA
jgi:hypothetical protein